MNHARQFRSLALFALSAAAGLALSPLALAQGVLGEWSSITAPPPPQLESVTVDPQTTALLVMDFGTLLCNDQRVTRCLSDIPNVKKLLDEARTHHMLVIYTGFPHLGAYVKDIMPMHRDPMVVGHADKFDGTNLNGILKSHGIKTVITTGVVANGAVLFTAFGAASHGYKVIVPVDTMPGPSAYAEQSAIWNIANDPGLGTRVATLTSSDMIKF